MANELETRPGYQIFIRGHISRELMQRTNREAGLPCYCDSIWTGYCDFCTGLVPRDGDRWKQQLEEQKALDEKIKIVQQTLCFMIVCSCLSQLDVETFMLNVESGTRNGWTLSRQTQPKPCEKLPKTHTHYVFEC